MSAWSERDLARIGAADEILVAPDQGDRSRGPAVPIWVVRVGDELYVAPTAEPLAAGTGGRVSAATVESAHAGMSFASDSVK
jgi:hypothetical protein